MPLCVGQWEKCIPFAACMCPSFLGKSYMYEKNKEQKKKGKGDAVCKEQRILL